MLAAVHLCMGLDYISDVEIFIIAIFINYQQHEMKYKHIKSVLLFVSTILMQKKSER